MAKIAFFELEDWEKEFVTKSLGSHKIFFCKDKLSEKNASKVADADIVATFIYSRMDEKLLSFLPKVKLIATMSTGFDHIDLDACTNRKITVCNVPTYGENTVAEHTFALLLAISRKIPESIERARKGDFRLDGLRGFDLKGKTIGIIGCGNIGKHVARIANGFEMNVLVYDAKNDLKTARKYGFTYETLPSLLRKSDIITLHVPENKNTHHLMNSKTLGMCKKGAILLNTSRGGIVDTSALLKALSDKTIQYAGLDVLEGECFIREEKELLHPEFMKTCDLQTVLQNNILLRNPQVYITQHNAFNSKEAMLRILNTTIENINAFVEKKPINVVK